MQPVATKRAEFWTVWCSCIIHNEAFGNQMEAAYIKRDQIMDLAKLLIRFQEARIRIPWCANYIKFSIIVPYTTESISYSKLDDS